MPTTVMHIKTDKKTGKAAAEVAKERAAEAGETVKEFAGQAGRPRRSREAGRKVREQARRHHHGGERAEAEAVAEEAKKGYDLLIIGLDKTVARKNEFHDDVTKLAAGFEGPLAVVDARDEHRERTARRQAQHPGAGQRHRCFAPRRRGRHRAGARQQGAADRALRHPGRQEERRANTRKRSSRTSSNWRKPTRWTLRTAVRADVAPDEAIMKETARRKHNLVVMGVGRRPGEKLFFGDTAAALLEKSERSLLFAAMVSTRSPSPISAG